MRNSGVDGPVRLNPLGPFHLSREEICAWWDSLDETQKNPPPRAKVPVSADSYVYFIQCGDLVKIGVAKDVQGRLATLQTGNPAELNLLFYIPGDKDLERELQGRFYADSVGREWFRLSDEILAFIEADQSAINPPTEFTERS